MKYLVMIAMFITLILQAQTATPPSAGDGTTGNPYQIATLDNLYWIAASDAAVPTPSQSARWSSHYIQTADIDAAATSSWNSGAGWSPIGNSTIRFSGSYNGNGNIIQNLYIYRPASNYIGFFGILLGATVKDLGLVNVDIRGRSNIGALSGYTGGSSVSIQTYIYRCYSSGNVKSATENSTNSIYMGGLIGYSYDYTHIYDSYSRAKVTAGRYYNDNFLAGFIGGLNGSRGTLDNCYSTGLIEAYTVLNGGFIGLLGGMNSPSINNCFWDKQTSGFTNGIGQYNSGTYTLTGCETDTMKTESTFTGAGWNFSTIWGIDGIYNGGYPFLQWERMSLPSVTTQNVTGISTTYATGNGTIIDLGFPSPTQHGFCWNTSGMPTLTDNKTEEGSADSLGVYTSQLLMLDNNTTYYVRAYATNSLGTVYGDEVIFKTLAILATQPSGTGSESDPYLISNIEELFWISQNSSKWDKYYTQTADIDASLSSALFPDGSGGYYGWSPIGNSTLKFTGNYDGQNKEISGLYINRPVEDNIGLFGYKNTGSVIRNINLDQVNITGKTAVGGITGYQYNSYIYDCFVSGSITAVTEAAGGIAGYTYYGGLSGCSSSANVTGGDLAGGLSGSNYSGSFSDCSASGNVNGNNNVGGLLGYVRSTVTNCYATGSVTGVNYVGGLAGSMYDGYSIKRSYSTGNVKGSASVGGLIGSTQFSAEISDCYSKGNVTRTNGSTDTAVAGFAGMNFRAKILRCFSTGSVSYEGTTSPTSKGMVGYVDTSSGYQMTGNFWDTETSLQTSTAGSASGKTTTEMKTLATYTGAGWDFLTPVWKMVDGVIYPFLAWQPSSYITFEGESNGIDGEYPEGTVLHLAGIVYPPGSSTGFDNWTDREGIILSEDIEFDYIVTDQDVTIIANYSTGSTDFNLSISNDGINVILNWDPILGAVYYQIYSSSDPYGLFQLDETGTFDGTSWTAPIVENKKFYCIVAYN